MIVLVGVSHHTAPIALREQLALSSEAAAQLEARLLSGPAIGEAFVLSTCNRVEIIVSTKTAATAEVEAAAEACLAELGRLVPAIRKHCYVRQDTEAMRHLVRVASSLDSLVVGEPQILGQLKQGFENARERGSIGPQLHRVFSRTVRGARTVRTGTGVGAGQVSVPSIAVQLATQIFGDLRGHCVVLLGSGEMGQAVARLLADSGAQVVVVGRSLERVQNVTALFGGEARTTSDLVEALAGADVVVSSTSAPGFVISRAMLEGLRRARKGRNLFLIDLAVPRDVDPAVGELDGVFLYNIDDLASVSAESSESRRRAADAAADVVEQVVQDWQRWNTAELATPTIKALRAQMRLALEAEMQRSLRGKLKDLDPEQQQALAKLLEAGLNRILHRPTVQLRELTAKHDGEAMEHAAEFLSDLFGLGELSEEDINASSLFPGSLPAPDAEEEVEADDGGAAARSGPASESPACVASGISGG